MIPLRLSSSLLVFALVIACPEGTIASDVGHKLPSVQDKLPALGPRQLYICDHVCQGCFHTDLTQDVRIGNHMVTQAYYCSKGCDLVKGAKLITIGGVSPPFLGYNEKYVPTMTGETHCWGPSPTQAKNDMGFLSRTGSSKYVKVFYPIPAAWATDISS